MHEDLLKELLELIIDNQCKIMYELANNRDPLGLDSRAHLLHKQIRDTNKKTQDINVRW